MTSTVYAFGSLAGKKYTRRNRTVKPTLRLQPIKKPLLDAEDFFIQSLERDENYLWIKFERDSLSEEIEREGRHTSEREALLRHHKSIEISPPERRGISRLWARLSGQLAREIETAKIAKERQDQQHANELKQLADRHRLETKNAAELKCRQDKALQEKINQHQKRTLVTHLQPVLEKEMENIQRAIARPVGNARERERSLER